MKIAFHFIIIFVFSVVLPYNLSAQDKNITVLITGANRGLGLEMTKQFIADGYNVIGTARKPERAADLKATGATIVQLDVANQESIDAMVKLLNGQAIDILINNAGYYGPNKLDTEPDKLNNVTRGENRNLF